jgi:hypothetical protein
MWGFMLRRVLNAAILVFLEDDLWQLTLLFVVNLFALLWSAISRPYNDVLVNVHLIMNDIAVLIVIAEFYVYREAYLTDEYFYLYGKMIIGTVAGVVLLNCMLFIISFIIGVIRFCKKCCQCKKKVRSKEPVIRDPIVIIPGIEVPPETPEEESLVKTPTPPPEPEPEKPKTPTPPPETEKTPTPTPTPSSSEESSDDVEVNIPASSVLVTDSKFNNPAAKGDVAGNLMGNKQVAGFDTEGNMTRA